MSEYEVEGYGTSPAGQRVEFRTYPREGDSRAERRAHVVVAGRTVARGHACDGRTYAAFDRWLKGTATEDDGACMFHGRPYPEHDFYYGDQCRRCGKERVSA